MPSIPDRQTEPPATGRYAQLWYIWLAVAVLGLAVLVWFSTRPETDTTERSAEIAPDFSVSLFDGSEFTLSQHLQTDGRPVMLNFYASWCIPCRTEIPELDLFSRQQQEVLVLGVAVRDTEADARALVDQLQPSYPTGIDLSELLVSSYPAVGMPATFLIGTDQQLLTTHNGAINSDQLADLVEQFLN